MKEVADQVKTTPLPAGLKWYEVGGQTLLALYSASGFPTFKLRSILIQKMPEPDFGDFGPEPWVVIERDGGRWVNLDFWINDTAEQVREKIDRAIRLLTGENHA